MSDDSPFPAIPRITARGYRIRPTGSTRWSWLVTCYDGPMEHSFIVWGSRDRAERRAIKHLAIRAAERKHFASLSIERKVPDE